MTLAEFKAWFEGFTESMDGAPDEKQWDRIKARVKEIDGVNITQPVFIDRYVYPYRRYYDGVWWGTGYSTADSVGTVLQNAVSTAKAINAEFDSHVAMLDLGKAEYQSYVATA